MNITIAMHDIRLAGHIGAPSSSFCVARGSIMVGNVGIFWRFLGVLQFLQFHPTNTIHFMFISYSHSSKSRSGF